MGKKKELKLSKDKNKEGATSLLENWSLKDDCLEDVELNSNKNGHKEGKTERKVFVVNDIVKGMMERRSKGNKKKVISLKDGVGEEHDLELAVCDKNVGRSNSGNKENKTKNVKDKEDGEDAGRGVNSEMKCVVENYRKVKKSKRLREKISDDIVGDKVRGPPTVEKTSKRKCEKISGDIVDSKMNGVVESDRKVKKSKRKHEKISDDIVDDDFSDGKEWRPPAVDKTSKVEEKSHKSDLFAGNDNESSGTHGKERKRVGGMESNDSEGNKQFADIDMGKNGKKMKTKKIPIDNNLGSKGRDGYDMMETGLDMAACESIPFIPLEGLSTHDVVNSETHESAKIKKKKKTTKIGPAQVEADNHLPEGKECREELTSEKDVVTIGQSSHLADEEKSTQGIGSSEMGGDGKKIMSKKSKMRKGNKHVLEGKECNDVSHNEKGVESSDHSSKLKSKKKSKRVSFSDEVEVLDLIRGKRFTKEEDEKIIDSVHSYIRSHGLGDEGLKKILNCRLYPEVKHCWKEIVAVLPNRPYESVYYRAHTLLERAEDRKWTPEEREVVRRFYENHGADWKMLADALGKHRKHVKDYWRRIKWDFKTRGWSQEEYQTLFDLVNQDLRLRALEENRKSKHGMLRDNIPWESISDILTRSNSTCCRKWYEQLTSPMVIEGVWSDTDDYRLVGALYKLDACSMEEVEWDLLLEHRTGDICRKRWNQMIRHIGGQGNKSFVEQVEILSKRYCPHLVEEREAFDSKPVVD